jgi:Trk K+ transport system NAD-binding subunit
VLGGVLARAAGQPLILGYVVGGILISPLTPGPAVSDLHTFELFAEIGVILLMFSIGIEFSLRDLLRVKWVAMVGGPLGILPRRAGRASRDAAGADRAHRPRQVPDLDGGGAPLPSPAVDRRAGRRRPHPDRGVSFILVQGARSAGHVGDDVYQATLAASLLTILGNAALIKTVPRWLGGMRVEQPGAAADVAGPSRLRDHVVICGFGRVGSAVGEALETFGVPYVAIETDPDIVRSLRARKVACLLGDAADRGVLDRAGIQDAALVMVTLPDVERADATVHHARALNPTVRILARAHHPAGHDRLMAAGATEVIQPEFEAASTLIRHALRGFDLPRERVLAYLDRLRQAMDATPPTPMPAGITLPELKEIPVRGGGIADVSLRDSRIRERFGVTVMAISRSEGGTLLHPSPDAVIRPGDGLLVFGLGEQIGAFEREAAAES